MQNLRDRVLESLKKRPGLTQAQLARACHVSTASVAGWLNGTSKSMRASTARLAAEAIGCSSAWIGEGIGEPQWAEWTKGGFVTPESSPLQQVGFTLPHLLTWQNLREMITLPKTFLVAMPDEALAPHVMPGTQLIFAVGIPPTPGAGVLVEDDRGARYIRRYAEGLHGAWLAQATNPLYVTLESARDGARVLAAMTGRLDGRVG
jgi:transcriptional regulator with XRE-family HTH domain